VDSIERQIYINGTPLLSATGERSFRGVGVAYRNGSVSQLPITDAGYTVASTLSVPAQKISTAIGPIVRRISNLEATAAQITLTTPSLRSKSGNDVVGSYVKFRVEISANGGAYFNYLEDAFDGKTTGYSRDYRIKLPTNGPWDIRVSRLSPDVPANEIQNTQNNLIWDKTAIILDNQFAYPNTAIIFLRFDAAFFSSEPTIEVKCPTILLKVPDNYNAALKTYSGNWTGVFSLDSTSNPAWIVYNLLINYRWGLKARIPESRIDKWAFYTFAKYCDQLVDNGKGIMKPRHTFNQYVRSLSDAIKSVNDILKSCRATIYDAGGQLSLDFDRAGKPYGKIYTNSNVITKYSDRGELEVPGFSYEAININDLPSAINVKWYNAENFGEPEMIRVTLQDIGLPELLTRYGEREKEIDLQWCGDVDEARRYGLYEMISAHKEQWTVTFSVDESILNHNLGELIAIQDNQTNSEWLGGKINAVTANTITLDRPIKVATSGIVVLIENIDGIQGIPVLNPITSIASNVIDCNLDPLKLPSIGSEWLLDSDTAPIEVFKILSILDKEDGTYGIIAKQYDESKFFASDGGVSIVFGVDRSTKPLPPTQLRVYYDFNQTHIGWLASPSTRIAGYRLEYQILMTETWQPVFINSNYLDYNLPPTSTPYSIRVATIGNSGTLSEWIYSGAFSDAINANSNTTTPPGTSGNVIRNNVGGSAQLDRPVYLQAGEIYWIITDSLDGESGYISNYYSSAAVRLSIESTGQTNVVRPLVHYLEYGVLKAVNSGFLGAAGWFYGPADINLSNFTINNRLSYLQVSGGTVTLFDGIFSGSAQRFSEGSYDLSASQSSFANDTASSIRIEGNTSVYISQNPPYKNPRANSPWIIGRQIASGTLIDYYSPTELTLESPLIAAPGKSYRLITMHPGEQSASNNYQVYPTTGNKVIPNFFTSTFYNSPNNPSTTFNVAGASFNGNLINADYLQVSGGGVVRLDADATGSTPAFSKNYGTGTFDLRLNLFGGNIARLTVPRGSFARLSVGGTPPIYPYPSGTKYYVVEY
jgi:hypothetical protein